MEVSFSSVPMIYLVIANNTFTVSFIFVFLQIPLKVCTSGNNCTTMVNSTTPVMIMEDIFDSDFDGSGTSKGVIRPFHLFYHSDMNALALVQSFDKYSKSLFVSIGTDFAISSPSVPIEGSHFDLKSLTASLMNLKKLLMRTCRGIPLLCGKCNPYVRQSRPQF